VHIRTEATVGNVSFKQFRELGSTGRAAFLSQVILEPLDHRSRINRSFGLGQSPIEVK
jgi:hypothetical protein